MTATTVPIRRVRFGSAVTHTVVITWRNVMRVLRQPQLLVFSTIQPVMFLVLFNYVFGGAISIGGGTSGSGNY
ncbi:MAG TPA: ABC transporter permease, partial [Acidimicrobiia bacterium]|nr:ABC transporter permease [Acidimicrobiia bacterium]